MDIDEIRQLVELMVANDLSELDISDGETKVRVKRGPGGEPVVTQTGGGPPQPWPTGAPQPPEAEAEGEEPAEELIEITSPMVGTYYSSASPDSEPYVEAGSEVQEDTVVCIVEAMKVMNEIKAECRGIVTEVCVQNAQPVEYGQVLLRVRPA